MIWYAALAAVGLRGAGASWSGWLVSSKCTSASATPGIARMARCNCGAISYAFALLTIRTCSDATGQADADGNGRHYDRRPWADGVQYPPCSLPGAGGSTLTEPSAVPSAVSGVCVCVRVRTCVCVCLCVCVCVCERERAVGGGAHRDTDASTLDWTVEPVANQMAREVRDARDVRKAERDSANLRTRRVL